MPKVLNLLRILIILLTFSPSLLAFNSSSGADFLNTNVSTRSEGMGGADVAVLTDISGVNLNPASMAFLKVPEVYYLHKATLSEFQTEYLALGTPLGLFIKSNRSLGRNFRWVRKLRTSMSVMYWHTSPIDEVGNESATVLNSLTARDLAVSVGAGYNIRGYRVGGSFKYINRTLASYSASSIAFDLGVLKGFEVFRPLPYQRRYNLRAGLAIQNLGPGIQFIDESDPLPVKIKPGVTYGVFANRDHMVDFSLNLTQHMADSALTVHNGLEYRVFNSIFFRTGLEISPDGTAFTMGTGGKYTFRKVTYKMDYSFWSRVDGVPDNHGFSLLAQLNFVTIGKKKRVTSLGIIEGNDKPDTSKKVDDKKEDGGPSKIKLRKKKR